MKKKFIDKVEQQLKDNMQKQEEQFFSDTHDSLMDRMKEPAERLKQYKNDLPGIGSTSFKIELNRDWYSNPNILNEKLLVVSEPKSPLYQRILSWLTFGLYKPTSFSYEVKEVEHEK